MCLGAVGSQCMSGELVVKSHEQAFFPAVWRCKKKKVENYLVNILYAAMKSLTEVGMTEYFTGISLMQFYPHGFSRERKKKQLNLHEMVQSDAIDKELELGFLISVMAQRCLSLEALHEAGVQRYIE